MSSSAWPDLSGLATLAREQNLDVRPVLLRVQTDLFVTAPSRDRASIEAFEALALGFIPLVDDDTAAIVARKLAAVADTPASVLAALERRGGEARSAVRRRPSEPAPPIPRQEAAPKPPEPVREVSGDILNDLLGLEDDDIDLVLAGKGDIRLHDDAVEQLVARGRERPRLATLLMERPEITTADAAALYLHADAQRRPAIRAALEGQVALARAPLPTAAAEPARAELVALAGAGNAIGFGDRLARVLGMRSVPAWRFAEPSRHELLALGLVAAGVPADEAIRIFLTLHAEIARSVPTVFHLAELARTVPRPVAAGLVEAIVGVASAPRRDGRHVPAVETGGAFERLGMSRERPAQERTATMMPPVRRSRSA